CPCHQSVHRSRVAPSEDTRVSEKTVAPGGGDQGRYANSDTGGIRASPFCAASSLGRVHALSISSPIACAVCARHLHLQGSIRNPSSLSAFALASPPESE